MKNINHSDRFYELVEQKKINVKCLEDLKNTDWKIIRELERLFLSETVISKEREVIRNKYIEIDWNEAGGN